MRGENAKCEAQALRSPSLAELAYREIERMILSRALSAGERLNDSQLAKRFGISRGPVRDAIVRLAQGGLVDVIPYRGAFVRVIELDDALEIYDIRAALERAGVIKAKEHLTPKLLQQLREQVHIMEHAGQTDDGETYFEANLAFHRLIHKASGNRRLMDLYERYSREIRLFRHLSLVTSGIQESNEEHHRILAALEHGDVYDAASEMESHVLRAKERLVRLAERLQSQPESRRILPEPP